MSKTPSRTIRVCTDYSPLAAPPNPHEEQARAAKREYMKQMLHVSHIDMATGISIDAPHIDDGQEFSTVESICGGDNMASNDAAKIAAALAQWPDIARHHLRVGVGWAWDAARQCHVERDGLVVYDTSEDDAVPHVGGTRDAQDAQDAQKG